MILLDTSFLVALTVRTDKNHQLAIQAVQKMRHSQVIVTPVLQELFYILRGKVSYEIAVRLTETIFRAAYRFEDVNLSDRYRMLEIMKRYADAELDFTDCAIMALSERLNITRVATFDRRDFSIFRPLHCAALELIPT